MGSSRTRSLWLFHQTCLIVMTMYLLHTCVAIDVPGDERYKYSCERGSPGQTVRKLRTRVSGAWQMIGKIDMDLDFQVRRSRRIRYTELMEDPNKPPLPLHEKWIRIYLDTPGLRLEDIEVVVQKIPSTRDGVTERAARIALLHTDRYMRGKVVRIAYGDNNIYWDVLWHTPFSEAVRQLGRESRKVIQSYTISNIGGRLRQISVSAHLVPVGTPGSPPMGRYSAPEEDMGSVEDGLPDLNMP